MPSCRRGGRAGFGVVGRPRRVRRGEGTPPYGAGIRFVTVLGGGVLDAPHVYHRLLFSLYLHFIPIHRRFIPLCLQNFPLCGTLKPTQGATPHRTTKENAAMKNTKSVHPHKLAAAAVILVCMLGAGLTGCSTTLRCRHTNGRRCRGRRPRRPARLLWNAVGRHLRFSCVINAVSCGMGCNGAGIFYNRGMVHFF